MSKTVTEIQDEIIARVISGNNATTAFNLRILLNEMSTAYMNFASGGLLSTVEIGYLNAFRPTSPGAFATVDMIGAAGASEVTSAPTIALLVNDANWTNNRYTGTTITGQSAGDFYINDSYDYKFWTRSGVLSVRRIPYAGL